MRLGHKRPTSLLPQAMYALPSSLLLATARSLEEPNTLLRPESVKPCSKQIDLAAAR
jgi:hypothetical protein